MDVEHSFVVDELGISVEVHAGETTSLTVDAVPGGHGFSCEHHLAQMRGTMTVQ